MVSNLLPGTPAVAGLVPPPVDVGRHGQARFTSGTAHSSPPLPQLLAAGPTELTEYGLSTLSVTGRLADREVLRRLGWAAGTRLEMREHHGLIVVTADLRGVFRVSGQGFLIPRPWSGGGAACGPAIESCWSLIPTRAGW